MRFREAVEAAWSVPGNPGPLRDVALSFWWAAVWVRAATRLRAEHDELVAAVGRYARGPWNRQRERGQRIRHHLSRALDRAHYGPS